MKKKHIVFAISCIIGWTARSEQIATYEFNSMAFLSMLASSDSQANTITADGAPTDYNALGSLTPDLNNAEGIYHPAKPGQFDVPDELYSIEMRVDFGDGPLHWIKNAEAFGLNPKDWMNDGSRIIYHNGKYHVWLYTLQRNQISDKDRQRIKRESVALYLNSEDGKAWQAVHRVPLGPSGSSWDRELMQVNVVYHKGKFYMFSEGHTTNTEKYGQSRAGIVCLISDSPEGPWKQPEGIDLLLEPGPPGAWDHMFVTNPRVVFFNGKWLMYYKGRKDRESWTDNGLAIADHILGPYEKFGGNPLLKGHGHFAFRYKHGILMIPHYEDSLLWTEDGVHFETVLRNDTNVFWYGTLYSPYDPTFGEPQLPGVDHVRKYFGLQSVRIPFNKNDPEQVYLRDYDEYPMDWIIGPQDENTRRSK